MKNEVKSLLVDPSASMKLSKIDPDTTFGIKKEKLMDDLAELVETMEEFQHKLYVENKKALLIVLQGMDTSGKDGVITHVMKGFNPLSCRVESFKAPAGEELAHDFLWRIHKVTPQKGFIGVFNRSHYEDIIEPQVWNLFPKSVYMERYDNIIQFEKYLSDNKIKIIKFYLHISKEEQKERLLSRLSHPSKRWKVNEEDFQKRKKWAKYMQAYEDVINRCSTKWAPWYIIPSNNKCFRNWAIAKIVVETLKEMKPKYPKYVPPKIGIKSSSQEQLVS
jgi:PPK2 family polyphosphate:nucleotide phosphotransferase